MWLVCRTRRNGVWWRPARSGRWACFPKADVQVQALHGELLVARHAAVCRPRVTVTFCDLKQVKYLDYHYC